MSDNEGNEDGSLAWVVNPDVFAEGDHQLLLQLEVLEVESIDLSTCVEVRLLYFVLVKEHSLDSKEVDVLFLSWLWVFGRLSLDLYELPVAMTYSVGP